MRKSGGVDAHQALRTECEEKEEEGRSIEDEEKMNEHDRVLLNLQSGLS